MEKTKLRYEVPEAETFVVRFEGVLCQSRNVSLGGKKGSGYGSSMYYLDDEEEE